ncbi:hypothetical protein ACFQY4_22045 [Catellatospora bangladeshensis]|uniref:DUF1877 family protein n=1 Tax=Catellatospora bangladeshensis TaxID=310355 RepID=A0A8J3JM75_9ACTN|nr:hypothetical protein [Catellatospora bangladeshensis]GIF80494.1 hypothetical protein Cba03nite_18430 [Catellatospora bangladeshensis]
MGVLFDYFRAVDDATAVHLMDGLEGGPIAVPDGSVDAVDLRGIDPYVRLGQLLSLAREVEWEWDTARTGLLWPEEDQDDSVPFLLSLGDGARDTLAGLTAEHMADLSAQWARIEEPGAADGEPAGPILPFIEEIAGLARRAQAAGDHLYCWCGP